MCYSIEIWTAYENFVNVHGAVIDVAEYAKLYEFRTEHDRKFKIARGIDRNYRHPKSEDERRTAESIAEFDRWQLDTWQDELLAQKHRLQVAEASIATKHTKTAEKELAVASRLVARLSRNILDYQRPSSGDTTRIFSGVYAPVMIWENGRRVVKPMMYRLRPHGWPAEVEKKKQGTYNARYDALRTTWRHHFGVLHGVVLAPAFYEHVRRGDLEKRPMSLEEADQDVVLKFEPKPRHDMVLACLYSTWGGFGQPEMLSFAAITVDPPNEVAAAGHNRCIVPIKSENIDAWLQPNGDLQAMFRILDDRERPFYDHQVAMAA